MGILLNRPVTWCAAPILTFLLWSALNASSQTLESQVRSSLDTAAREIASFIHQALPDDSTSIVAIEPILTDIDRRLTALGVRLRGTLQITLLNDYSHIRVVEDPSRDTAAESTTRVVAELQPFDDRVFVLVRIIDRSEFLIDAVLIEILRTPGISRLLIPNVSPTVQEQNSDPSSGERSSKNTGSTQSHSVESNPIYDVSRDSLNSPKIESDPYEPDDTPGFEVPLPLVNPLRFERSLSPEDRDRFKLVIAEPTAVIIEVSSSIETLIVLYGNTSTVPISLHENRFSQHLHSGTYIVEVVAAGSKATGDYVLSFRNENQSLYVDSEVVAVTDAIILEFDEPENEPHQQEEFLKIIELQPGQLHKHLISQQQAAFQIKAVPRFYGVTLRSEIAALNAKLHKKPEGEPFLQLSLSTPNELVGAVFIGAQAPYIMVEVPLQNQNRSFEIIVEPITPPRVFADQTWASQYLMGSVGYHALRVFRQEVYQISLDAFNLNRAEITVFQLPNMMMTSSQEVITPGRYDLSPGDYFVMVRYLDMAAVGRTCWRRVIALRTCR